METGRMHLALFRSQRKGIVVGSLFPVEKISGYSLKWKGKVRDADGNLMDVNEEELIQTLLQSGCFSTDAQGRNKGMLVLKNNRKREGRRDPEYIIYAFPEEQQ